MMKKRMLRASVFLALSVAGCGTLTRSISHNGLTRADMDFIGSVKPLEKPRVITIDEGQIELPTRRRARLDIPPLLNFYTKGFAMVEPGDQYYYVRATSFFCIFLDSYATVFNAEGRPRHRESRLWLSCFLFQHRRTTLNVDTPKPERHWSVRMINIPFTDLTFLGFGTDYLQLLFIPLITPAKQVEGTQEA